MLDLVSDSPSDPFSSPSSVSTRLSWHFGVWQSLWSYQADFCLPGRKMWAVGEGCVLPSIPSVYYLLLRLIIEGFFGGNIFPVLCDSNPALAYLGGVAAEMQAWNSTKAPGLVVSRASRKEGKPHHHTAGQGKGRWVLVKLSSLRFNHNQSQFLQCTWSWGAW